MSATCDRCREPLDDAAVDPDTWERTGKLRCRLCGQIDRGAGILFDEVATSIAAMLDGIFVHGETAKLLSTDFAKGGVVGRAGGIVPAREFNFPVGGEFRHLGTFRMTPELRSHLITGQRQTITLTVGEKKSDG